MSFLALQIMRSKEALIELLLQSKSVSILDLNELKIWDFLH